MLLAASLEPKACASIAPANLALRDIQDHKPYLDQLLLFRKTRFTLTLPLCTLVLCQALDGAPRDCCNKCREDVELSGFHGVSIVGPDGQRVGCEERRDCEPPSCPSWLGLGKDLEVTGAFRAEDGRLEFLLAKEPTN